MSRPTITLIESLVNKSHAYVETQLELFKLKIVDKASDVASNIAAGIAMFLIFFIFFIIVNIGLALLIGDLLGKSYYGFFILAALYALAGLVLYKSKNKWIKGPIVKMFLQKFVKNTTWDK